jgi:hypothetical protein
MIPNVPPQRAQRLPSGPYPGRLLSPDAEWLDEAIGQANYRRRREARSHHGTNRAAGRRAVRSDGADKHRLGARPPVPPCKGSDLELPR